DVQVSTAGGTRWHNVASKRTTLHGQAHEALANDEQATASSPSPNTRWRRYEPHLAVEEHGSSLNTSVVGIKVSWDKKGDEMYASATPSPTTPAKFLLFAQR